MARPQCDAPLVLHLCEKQGTNAKSELRPNLCSKHWEKRRYVCLVHVSDIWLLSSCFMSWLMKKMLEFPLEFQICSVRLPLKYIYNKFSGRSFFTYPFPLLILHLINTIIITRYGLACFVNHASNHTIYHHNIWAHTLSEKQNTWEYSTRNR